MRRKKSHFWKDKGPNGNIRQKRALCFNYLFKKGVGQPLDPWEPDISGSGHQRVKGSGLKVENHVKSDQIDLK